MRPLVAVRRSTPFDATRLSGSPLLAHLQPALRRLGRLDDFPPVDALARVFDQEAPVRFVASAPRARSRGARARGGADANPEPRRVDPSTMYDGRIAIDRCVPTRAHCWHDLANALVWGTFPRAKLALHERQHQAIAARVAGGARVLPPTRTRELDALALLDEGGVVVSADDPETTSASLRRPGALREWLGAGRAEAVVFGHAIVESLALGVTPAVVAAIVVPRARGAPPRLDDLDASVGAALRDSSQFQTPTALCRVDLAALDEPHFATQMLTRGLTCS
jgi:hypothetical protein